VDENCDAKRWKKCKTVMIANPIYIIELHNTIF